MNKGPKALPGEWQFINNWAASGKKWITSVRTIWGVSLRPDEEDPRDPGGAWSNHRLRNISRASILQLENFYRIVRRAYILCRMHALHPSFLFLSLRYLKTHTLRFSIFLDWPYTYRLPDLGSFPPKSLKFPSHFYFFYRVYFIILRAVVLQLRCPFQRSLRRRYRLGNLLRF